MDGASPEVCESWVVAYRRLFDDERCPSGWGPNLLGHGDDGVGYCCEVRADGLLVVLGALLVRAAATIGSRVHRGICTRPRWLEMLVLRVSAAPWWRVRVYAQTPVGETAPVWDSAVVGADSRLWLVREGLCSLSCREVHMCAHLSAQPCWVSLLLVLVHSCTMITCQGCDPGTTPGGVVCSWACNHTAVSAGAVR